MDRKYCSTCGRIKLLTEFYLQDGRKDGRRSQCKGCISSCTKRRYYERGGKEKHQKSNWKWKRSLSGRESARRYRQSEKGKSTNRRYDISPKGKVAARRKEKTHLKKFPERCRTKISVLNAKRSGKLKPPKKCSLCGAVGPVQVHHPDYLQPLLVAWLCSRCHGKRHGKVKIGK